MNGAQDLGGMMGFGPIRPDPLEPLFHADWEKRAMGMTIAAGMTGCWNIDKSRSFRESLPPAEYLSSSYYAIWLKALERLALEVGLVTSEELRRGVALTPPIPVKRVLKPADVAATLARGGPTDRPATGPARFREGDRVITRNINPTTHTRLPRYARGKAGIVERLHGAHVFPDSNAQGLGEAPQWLYTVRFSASALWGEAADPTQSVSIDAWESYLESR